MGELIRALWYSSLEGINKTIHLRKADVYNREFATLLCSKGPFAPSKRDTAIHVYIYIYIYINKCTNSYADWSLICPGQAGAQHNVARGPFITF
jgi:hypothetical protein